MPLAEFTGDEERYCRRHDADRSTNVEEAGEGLDAAEASAARLTQAQIEKETAAEEWQQQFPTLLTTLRSKRDSFVEAMNLMISTEVTMCTGGITESDNQLWQQFNYCKNGTTTYPMFAQNSLLCHSGKGFYGYENMDSEYTNFNTTYPANGDCSGNSGWIQAPNGCMGEFWYAYKEQCTGNGFSTLFGLEEITADGGSSIFYNLDADSSSRASPTDLSPFEQVSDQAFDVLANHSWIDTLIKFYNSFGYDSMSSADPSLDNNSHTWKNLFHTVYKRPNTETEDRVPGPDLSGEDFYTPPGGTSAGAWMIGDRMNLMRFNMLFSDHRNGGYDSGYPNSFWRNMHVSELYANCGSEGIGMGHYSYSALGIDSSYFEENGSWHSEYMLAWNACQNYDVAGVEEPQVQSILNWYIANNDQDCVRTADSPTRRGIIGYNSGSPIRRMNSKPQPRQLTNNSEFDLGHDRWRLAKEAYVEIIEALKAIVSAAAKIWCAKEEVLVRYAEEIERLQGGTAAEQGLAQRMLAEMEAVEEGSPSMLTADYQRRQLFKEQCFLLAACDHLARHKQSSIERPGKNVFRRGGEYIGLSAVGGASSTAAQTPWRPKKLPYETVSSDDIDETYRGYFRSSNACLLVDGDPYAFINRLTQNPNQRELFDAQTKDISTLVPTMRFYKVETVGERQAQQEIIFDSYATPQEVSSLTQNLNKRSFGVGLQSFDVKYEGSNFFAVNKSIKATLKIFASSFQELLREQNESGGFRYVDLALKTGGREDEGRGCDGSTTAEEENVDRAKLNFRLKAVIGWAVPNGNTDHMSFGVRDALYDSYVTLNLTPTVHNFQIDDEGRVVLSIDYLAYAEDFYDQEQFSIFTNTDTLTSQVLRRLSYEHYRGVCSSEQLNNIKSSYQELKDDETRANISQLVQDMVTRRQIYNIRMDADDMEDYMRRGPFHSNTPDFIPTNNTFPSDLQTSISTAISRFTSDEANTNLGSVAQALTVTNPNQEYVSYFYVSDLIDNILQGIEHSMDELIDNVVDPPDRYANEPYEFELQLNECERLRKAQLLRDFKSNFPNFRLVLGPIELHELGTSQQTKYVNIGDLPISVKFFVEFLTDKLSSKEENSYSLTRFLNDFLNKLVRTFLNDDTCWNVPVTQRSTLNQCSISSYKTRFQGFMGDYSDYMDEITDYCKYHLGRYGNHFRGHDIVDSWPEETIYDGRLRMADVDLEDAPLLQISGPRRLPGGSPSTGATQECNYLIFYIGRSQPAEYMTGDQQFDEERGIFHYALGKDRGLIKKIQLQKTQTPGLAEVRFEQSGYDGLKQLLVQYDVKIDTYLNVRTFPGNYIFVDPRSFDPTSNLVPCDDSNLTEYGIGGYYIILSSEHSIGPGEATTKIVAKWVNKIGHDPDDDTHNACGSVQMAATDDDNGGESTNCGTWRAHRQEDSGGLGGTPRKGFSIESIVGLEGYAV